MAAPRRRFQYRSDRGRLRVVPPRRRISFADCAVDGDLNRSQLLEVPRTDPAAANAFMKTFTRDAVAAVDSILRADRERHAITKTIARASCGARHRRTPGRKPVRHAGSRRTSAPTRAGPADPDDPDPPGVSTPPARREIAGVFS